MFDPSQIPWHTSFWASDRNWSPPADGAATASWRDFSGNGRTASQATGSKQPVYHVADLGGKPCVTFDGVDDFMQTAAFTAIAQPATLVVVAQYVTQAAPNIVVDGIGTSNRMIVFDNANSRWTLYQGTVQQLTSPSPDNNAHILVGNFDAGSTDSLRLDGSLIISAVNAGTQAVTGLTLGARFDGTTNFANARVGFVGLIDRALTDSERIRLDSWVQDYYGIAVSDYQITGRLARSRRFKRV